MKKLIAGIAVGIAVLGFTGGKEAKADYDTLSGVADIIAATGTLVNPGYGPVYYTPAPVVYYDYGYPGYNYGGYGYYNHPYYRHYNNYYPRRYYRHCW